MDREQLFKFIVFLGGEIGKLENEMTTHTDKDKVAAFQANVIAYLEDTCSEYMS